MPVCILSVVSGHRMDVLSTACTVFGAIAVALAVYHWHLTRARPAAVGPRPEPGGSPRAAASVPYGTGRGHDVRVAPRARQQSGIFPRAVLHGSDASEREPLLGLDQRAVYTTAEAFGAPPELRGQRAAERVISGAGLARRPRRGRGAALDAIVVGASRDGVAATLRLLAAGLRVLLVDAGSGDGALTRSPRVREQLDAIGRERLPIVWGHRVLGIVERPDGMLELSAERAAWYTANVIIALPARRRLARERAA